MSTTSNEPYRRMLQSSIATICKQYGFDSVTKSALETLTELMQAHLSELTRSCRKFSELSQRTSPDLTDVKMALADVGSSAYGLHVYSKRVPQHQQKHLQTPKPAVEHKTLKPSLAKINQPSYVPNHFPEYPEVHAFVRTPAVREPTNQYKIVRERIANQRIAVEDSLIKFLSRTNDNKNLVKIFDDIDTNLFPAIEIPLDPKNYLKTLLPPSSDLYTELGIAMNPKQEKESVTKELDTVLPVETSTQNTVPSESPFLKLPTRWQQAP